MDENPLVLAATKSIIGHTEGSAGVAGALGNPAVGDDGDMGNIHTWVRVASVARPYQDDCRVQLQDGGHGKKERYEAQWLVAWFYAKGSNGALL